MFSSVFDSFRRGKVEANGVKMVPKELEQIARHRLLKIELDNLAIGHHPQFVWIGIRNGLNICPAPGPAVTTILCDIIDPAVLQPKCPVASTGPHAMMRRDFRDCRNAWERHAIAHRLSDARSELSRDLGRHRLTQGELKALLSRFVPVAILVAGYREFPTGEIEAMNFHVCPASIKFGGSEFHAVIIEQQCSRNRFLQGTVPTCGSFPICRRSSLSEDGSGERYTQNAGNQKTGLMSHT